MAQAKTNGAQKRRNSQYEKRLASILKATATIFAKEGYEGASVRRVAAKAKINLSGIYYYFQNKEELLFALQEHTFSTLVDSLKQRLERSKNPQQKLQAVIETHFQFFADNMEQLKVCVHEIESLSGTFYKKVEKIRKEYFFLVRKVVEEIVANGKRGRVDTNLAALFLFGSLNWVYMWFDPKKNLDTDYMTKQLLEITLNGIGNL